MRIRVDGPKLRAARERAGLTIAALASLVGVTEAAVGRVERGVSGGAGLRRDLAAALKIAPEELDEVAR